MLKSISIISSFFVAFSLFLFADQNITNQNLEVKNTQFLNNNVIKIRFYNQLPDINRIKCNMPCRKECFERLKIDSIKSFWSLSNPNSKTIGMTQTEYSQKVLRDGGGMWKPYFAEYEIDGEDGEFQLKYIFTIPNVSTKTLVYDVVLLSGKEYEIHNYQNHSGVYLINSDGTTSVVSTKYPKTCGFFDNKDTIK